MQHKQSLRAFVALAGIATATPAFSYSFLPAAFRPHRAGRPGQQTARQIIDLPGFFPTNFGRRAWTRTNDPHHVKVVL